MSAVQMIDMCVRYIARRHHMLTDRQVALLDDIWALYEPSELDLAQEIPLPPSPPPERRHVYFQDAEQPKREQAEWPCDQCLTQEVWECGQCIVQRQQEEQEQEQEEEERDRQADVLWRQVPQAAPVSAAMQHKEVCGCDTCEQQDRRREEKERLLELQEEAEQEQELAQWRWREYHERRQERARQEQEEEEGQEYRVPRCSDYLPTCDADGCAYECGTACGASAPAINLTCDRASCEYGCDSKHEPVGSAYPLPPPESCLYGCAFSCGAKEGEDCCAQFDLEGNQLAPAVNSVIDADTEDDMPPLIYMGARTTPKGFHNPEEQAEDETEIVNSGPPPQLTKPPKAKPLFPYNHLRWPSPRAKALVQWMIRRGRTSKEAVIDGEPTKSLTHDVCMRYLAKYHKLSHEKLLEKTIYELHNTDKYSPYWQSCKCPFCKDGYTYY